MFSILRYLSFRSYIEGGHSLGPEKFVTVPLLCESRDSVTVSMVLVWYAASKGEEEGVELLRITNVLIASSTSRVPTLWSL